MAFPSVYEMTNPLTTVRKQHFWEYFSGDPKRTTEQMFSFTTTDTYNALWGDRIFGMKLLSGYSGLGGYIQDIKTYFVNSALSTGTLYHVVLDASGTEIARSNGVLASSIGTGWVNDSFPNVVQINANYTVGYTITGGSGSSYLGNAANNNQSTPSNTERYYKDESGNVSTSTGETLLIVFDSVPATLVVPPYRWTANDVTGTNTFAMSDSVDGGFQITTGSGNGDHGTITFNDIRQYAHNGSTIIGVVKFDETTIDGAFGLSNSNSLGSSHSVLWSESVETNFKLSTQGTGARTETDTSVVRDTSTRTVKIVNGSSDVNMYFDNVLVSTISSPNPLPNASMQPIFYLKTQSAATKTGHITYCEAYNT